MAVLYADNNIEIYTMLDDEKLTLTYHYEVYSDETGEITHVDIRNLKAYSDANPTLFDLIQENRKIIVSKIIKGAIKINEIDFSKEHQ